MALSASLCPGYGDWRSSVCMVVMVVNVLPRPCPDVVIGVKIGMDDPQLTCDQSPGATLTTPSTFRHTYHVVGQDRPPPDASRRPPAR